MPWQGGRRAFTHKSRRLQNQWWCNRRNTTPDSVVIWQLPFDTHTYRDITYMTSSTFRPFSLIKLNSVTSASLIQSFIFILQSLRSPATFQYDEILATNQLLGCNQILLYAIFLQTLRILSYPEYSRETSSVRVKHGLKNIPVHQSHFLERFSKPENCK